MLYRPIITQWPNSFKNQCLDYLDHQVVSLKFLVNLYPLKILPSEFFILAWPVIQE